jgi:hypothetical protein
MGRKPPLEKHQSSPGRSAVPAAASAAGATGAAARHDRAAIPAAAAAAAAADAKLVRQLPREIVIDAPLPRVLEPLSPHAAARSGSPDMQGLIVAGPAASVVAALKAELHAETLKRVALEQKVRPLFFSSLSFFFILPLFRSISVFFFLSVSSAAFLFRWFFFTSCVYVFFSLIRIHT